MASLTAPQLRQVAAQAEAMVELARGDMESGRDREQQFAVVLYRHAKGVHAAARAWLQELANRA